MNIKKPEVLPNGINNRYYRDALVETIKQTGSKKVLEIGTNYGVTTRLIADVADFVVTTDIKEYSKIDLQNVKQLLVYPHTWDVLNWHIVTKNELKNIDDIIDTSYENLQIVEPYGPFDLIFLDGDHLEASFLADFAMCNALNPSYIVIDDYKNNEHQVYSTWKKNQSEFSDKYEEYDYGDWGVWVDMLMLKRKTNEQSN